MPFTFAHPAIVLPFGKIQAFPVSMSALVIGSVTPDFEYFIRMKLTGRYGHSLEGMLLMDLPLGIAIYLVFHLLVKGPLIDNLTLYFKSRLVELKEFDSLKYIAAYYHVWIFCLLVGIGGHILWDSFTHSNEYFVNQFVILKISLSFFDVINMPLYRWLQHASTVIGLIAIAIVFHRRRNVQIPFHSISLQFWVVIVIAGFTSFLLRAIFGFEYYGDVIATAIGSLCIGLILSSLTVRLNNG